MRSYNTLARAYKQRTYKVACSIAELGTIIDDEDEVCTNTLAEDSSDSEDSSSDIEDSSSDGEDSSSDSEDEPIPYLTMERRNIYADLPFESYDDEEDVEESDDDAALFSSDDEEDNITDSQSHSSNGVEQDFDRSDDEDDEDQGEAIWSYHEGQVSSSKAGWEYGSLRCMH